MFIDQALQLKRGDKVSCPADRGAPAFTGRVVSRGDSISKSIKGHDYLWVSVKTPMGHKELWPSNRIS